MARPSFWLMKTEPASFSIDDLAHRGREPWDGVRNYQARNFMRDDMRVGDGLLFYHSGGAEPGIVGLARVASKSYPDPTAFDPAAKHYDPDSDPEQPRWFLVDVAFVEKFPRLLALAELRRRDDLVGMALFARGQRLSVQPVLERHFKIIRALGRGS